MFVHRARNLAQSLSRDLLGMLGLPQDVSLADLPETLPATCSSNGGSRNAGAWDKLSNTALAELVLDELKGAPQQIRDQALTLVEDLRGMPTEDDARSVARKLDQHVATLGSQEKPDTRFSHEARQINALADKLRSGLLSKKLAAAADS